MNSDHLQEFVAECREGLDRIDSLLVALEANPIDRSGLHAVFRTLHTMKGNAGFLGLPQLGAIAHAGESLLSSLMGSPLRIEGEVADVLLQMSDAIRNIVSEVEATDREGNHNHATLIQELAHWTQKASEYSGEPQVDVRPAPVSRIQSESPATATSPVAEPAPQIAVPAEGDAAATKLDADDEPKPSPTPTFAEPKAPATVSGGESPPTGTVTTTTRSGDSSSTALPTRSADLETSLIRVRIDQLDDLVNLVGELVLARNRIVQITTSRSDDELTEPVQRLHRLTAALQEGVMRTRMQPVRNAWQKYPRIVRDLAKQCGKQCEVELQGGDTELDKSMLEAIADPLVHLVRNAIDHGIEKPYLRKIKGKPETGRLLVQAFQESGQVHIEITDDGAGMDLERIRKKVVEAGLVTAERVRQISESDLQNSVFLPGFTTADQVTNLSGRGVGMDVVKTCVEQIGGTIELRTQKDVGTTIRLTLPLTLAIVPAIMVATGSHRFAIPRINVVEMIRLRGDEQRALEQFHDTPVLRLRGELLPMVDLSSTLGIGPPLGSAIRQTHEIVVLKAGTRRYALLVDEIGDNQEIVVKPLGSLLEKHIEYSGAALMGDGTIALILDVLGITRISGLSSADQTLLGEAVSVGETAARLEEQVLICLADDRQLALPLTDVVCLEHIPRAAVESSATGDVLQYRGQILPVYDLRNDARRIPDQPTATRPLAVVIYQSASALLALVVDHIVDVAPRPQELNPIDATPTPSARHDVIATAVVLGRVTDFLEVN